MALARTYLEMNMPDEAVAPLRAASEAIRFRFEAASLLGRVHQQRGETPEAIEWFERAPRLRRRAPDEGHALLYDLGTLVERAAIRRGRWRSSSSCSRTRGRIAMSRSVSSASRGSKPEAGHFLLDTPAVRCLLSRSRPDPDSRAVVRVLGQELLRLRAAGDRTDRRQPLRARRGIGCGPRHVARGPGGAGAASPRAGDAESPVAPDPAVTMKAGLSRPVFCLVTDRHRAEGKAAEDATTTTSFGWFGMPQRGREPRSGPGARPRRSASRGADARHRRRGRRHVREGRRQRPRGYRARGAGAAGSTCVRIRHLPQRSERSFPPGF